VLQRRASGYYFRRAIPAELREILGRRELLASLATSSRPQAASRTAQLYVLGDALFQAARTVLAGGQSVEAGCGLRAAENDWAAAVTGFSRRAERFQQPDLTVRSYPQPAAPDRPEMMKMLAELLAGMQVAHPPPPHPASPAPLHPATEAPPPPSTPLFSLVAAEFLSGATHYTEATRRQTRLTADLLVEHLGDRPIGDYTGRDAGRFLDWLRRLPSNHGKSGRPMTATEAIAASDASRKPVQRISEKTVKRHCSAVSAIWAYARPRELVERNVWSGFRFAGTRAPSPRDVWSPADIRALFARPWRSTAVSLSTFRLSVAIAAYSGMRMEEICRLRPRYDFEQHDGRWMMIIQRHPDGWSPKTDSGERAVPVHPELLSLGLMAHVELMKRRNSQHLFPDLRPGSRDGELSAMLSKSFSNHKRAAGVTDATVFHSWRHNISTMLRNQAAEIRESWIDAVLGHRSTERSEGARTYLHKIGAGNLCRTIDAIRYDDVDLPALLRGEPEDGTQ
jgi:integrase